MERLTYRSKVDWWLAALVASAIVVPLIIGIRALLLGTASSETWTVLGSAAAAAVVISAVGVPVNYTLAEDELVVRFGWLRRRIPYRRIQSAEPSHSPWSSPAWSLDRVELILDDYQQVLISPVRKEEFLGELRQRIAKT